MAEKPSLSYVDAGVDIEAGYRLVEKIKPAVAKTRRPEVLAGLGGFGGLFRVPVDRYRKPVLVSGTDGVGTKLRLAIDMNHHSTIGIDLVAMCVNDVLVAGAEPLYFLDYYATGKLDIDIAASVITGIAAGCEQAGCALIGGETAEMPGMYDSDDYDLAGFCVGIADEDALIDGSRIAPGDVLLGLASSGLHSNGYSLVRKIIESSGANLDDRFDGTTLGERLLRPTRIYVKSILELIRTVPVKGMAHITGGGLDENLPRVLPENCVAKIDTASWQQAAIFDWLQENGGVSKVEMRRTFNCGIGMVVCIAEPDADRTAALLEKQGEQVFRLGHVDNGDRGVVFG